MLLEFSHPDRCVVGTVGEPGKRLFIIQVAQGNSLASVAVEKQQVQVLARRVSAILEQLEDLGHVSVSQVRVVDRGPLDVPIDIEFRAGAIGLAWDGERQAVQLELYSMGLGESDDDDDEANVLLQVWLTPRRAYEFALRSEEVVAAGRPTCPVCTQPLDAGGHICPRANGYRGPLFS